MRFDCTVLRVALISFIALQSCSPTKRFKVPTAGMEPAIVAEEEIVADMEAYRDVQPQPGDVVVFDSPSGKSTIVVKRCVAKGGQVVEIRNGVLYVDSVQFAPSLPLQRSSQKIAPAEFRDPRIYPPNAGNVDNYGPVSVPPGRFFMLGDHRDNSLDSRYFGFVESSAIRGKALSISYSEDKSRVGKAIN
jgi:signal peptidase I